MIEYIFFSKLIGFFLLFMVIALWDNNSYLVPVLHMQQPEIDFMSCWICAISKPSKSVLLELWISYDIILSNETKLYSSLFSWVIWGRVLCTFSVRGVSRADDFSSSPLSRLSSKAMSCELVSSWYSVGALRASWITLSASSRRCCFLEICKTRGSELFWAGNCRKTYNWGNGKVLFYSSSIVL